MTLAPEARTFCITGGTGFIGRHLVADLSRLPDTRLRLLTRHGLPAADVAGGPVTEVRGSLLDEAAVRRFVVPGAIVIHLAHARDEPADANVVMAENLSRACIEAPVAQFIHCGTAVVVGRPAVDTVVETVPCRPVTEYQGVKLRIERLLRERLGGRCPVSVLRPTAVFGPGGRNLCKPAGELIRRPWLVNLLKTMLFAQRRLHLVCVENVVAAVRFMLPRAIDLDGEIFIVSDDEAAESNYRDVLNLLAEELGVRQFPAARIPFRQAIAARALRMAGREDPNPRRVYSARKLRERGFRAPMELSVGVRQFARWYAEHPPYSG